MTVIKWTDAVSKRGIIINEEKLYIRNQPSFGDVALTTGACLVVAFALHKGHMEQVRRESCREGFRMAVQQMSPKGKVVQLPEWACRP